MSTVKTEQVMVVKTELFHQLGCFQGFNSDTQSYLATLLDPANTQYPVSYTHLTLPTNREV